jgi:hypothetical protein
MMCGYCAASGWNVAVATWVYVTPTVITVYPS